MTDQATIRHIARQIVASTRHFEPGADPAAATPIHQNLIDTYGNAAVEQAINHIYAHASKPRR